MLTAQPEIPPMGRSPHPHVSSASVRDDEFVIRKVINDAVLRDPAQVMTFVHEDAIVVPLLGPERALRASEIPGHVTDRFRRAKTLQARAHCVDRVADGRYLVEGALRTSFTEGGFKDSSVAWAVVMKDGRIYRMKGVFSAREAQRVLDQDDWSPPAANGRSEGRSAADDVNGA
jgi:hypothetical protein